MHQYSSQFAISDENQTCSDDSCFKVQHPDPICLGTICRDYQYGPMHFCSHWSLSRCPQESSRSKHLYDLLEVWVGPKYILRCFSVSDWERPPIYRFLNIEVHRERSEPQIWRSILQYPFRTLCKRFEDCLTVGNEARSHKEFQSCLLSF